MPSLTRLVSLLALLACSCATANHEPAALGYGSERDHELATGYVDAGPPFERQAPTAWPIDDQPRPAWAGPPPVLASAPQLAASPDIEVLCDHVVGFLSGSAGGPPIEPSAAARMDHFCRLQARTEKLARTSEQWQGLLACMLAADTDAEFSTCETDHPSALAGPTEHPREFEACQHLIITTLFEQLGSDTNLPASNLEPFRPVLQQCIDGLLADERPKRSAEAYSTLLDCMLEQSTSVAMEACE